MMLEWPMAMASTAVKQVKVSSGHNYANTNLQVHKVSSLLSHSSCPYRARTWTWTHIIIICIWLPLTSSLSWAYWGFLSICHSVSWFYSTSASPPAGFQSVWHQQWLNSFNFQVNTSGDKSASSVLKKNWSRPSTVLLLHQILFLWPFSVLHYVLCLWPTEYLPEKLHCSALAKSLG